MKQTWQNLGALSKLILNWSGLRGKPDVFAAIVSPWHLGWRRNGFAAGAKMQKAGETPAIVCESKGSSAGGDGARFGGNRGVFHRFGAAALVPGPRHDNLGFGACGDCGFQPAAFFFHDLLLKALSFVEDNLPRQCGKDLAAIAKSLRQAGRAGRQLWPFRPMG